MRVDSALLVRWFWSGERNDFSKFAVHESIKSIISLYGHRAWAIILLMTGSRARKCASLCARYQQFAGEHFHYADEKITTRKKEGGNDWRTGRKSALTAGSLILYSGSTVKIPFGLRGRPARISEITVYRTRQFHCSRASQKGPRKSDRCNLSE